MTEGVPFIRSQNVWNEALRSDDIALIPKNIHEQMSATHVPSGDVLYNITGASIGRTCLFPDSLQTANVSQHVSIVRPVLSREDLSNAKLSMSPIPLAPTDEQTEIVHRVDELMAFCDDHRATTETRGLNTQNLIETAFAAGEAT